MTELVTDSMEGGIAVLRLNAPERMNAICMDMRESLIAALQGRLLDDECKAVVLAGNGGHFSAGGDIKSERPEPGRIARTIRHKLSRLQEVVRLIVNAPKPVVAAVEGRAFGAGMSLAIACDSVVAAQNVQFGAVFGKVGLVPDAGMLYTLPRRVGGSRAQQLLLSARIVEADRALALGLADEIVPAGQTLAAACAEARRLAQIAPLALFTIKSMGSSGCDTLEQAFAQEMRLQPLLALSQDYGEARAAFAERRKPVFRGF